MKLSKTDKELVEKYYGWMLDDLNEYLEDIENDKLREKIYRGVMAKFERSI